MSLRFRRTMKLAPGLRLNITKQGFSISAGPRGAKLTIGTSGARVSAGIPGTGLYYSEKLGGSTSRPAASGHREVLSVTSSSQLESLIREGVVLANPVTGRRYSTVQLEAMLRRLRREEKFRESSSEVEAEQRAYNRVVNIARESLEVPSPDYWEDLLVERPFKAPEFTGEEPSREKIREGVSRRIHGGHRLPWFAWGYVILLLSVAGCVFLAARGLAGPALVATAGVALAAAVAGSLELAGKRKARRLELERAIEEETDRELEKQRAEYTRLKKEYEDRVKQAEAEHRRAERERVDFVRKLLDGDTEAMGRALEDLFSSLNLPVETEVGFVVSSPDAVFLDVDLPEIEDCVPATVKRVLKSGEIRERSKPEKTRRREYACIVVGLAYLLASHVFHELPTVKTVVVSGYTQRVSRKTGNLADEYVYSLEIDRGKFKGINFAAADPVAALDNFSGRWKISASYLMKPVVPLAPDEPA